MSRDTPPIVFLLGLTDTPFRLKDGKLLQKEKGCLKTNKDLRKRPLVLHGGSLGQETLIAKYPFLTEGKTLIGEGLPRDLEIREAVFFAQKSLHKQPCFPKSAEREVKNLLLARLMLYSAGISFLRKFAWLKSGEYERQLQEEEEETLAQIARDFFPSFQKEGPDSFKVSFIDCLQYGRNLNEAAVEKGMVFFDKHELLLCLRDAINVRVADHSKLDSRLPEPLAKASAELKESVKDVFARDNAFTAMKGKYLQRPELQAILKGVGEGKRYYGAMAIAIASMKDGMTKDQAMEVMQQYVENCSGGSHPFTQREGQSTVEWVYRHPGINFSFTTLKTQGLA